MVSHKATDWTDIARKEKQSGTWFFLNLVYSSILKASYICIKELHHKKAVTKLFGVRQSRLGPIQSQAVL